MASIAEELRQEGRQEGAVDALRQVLRTQLEQRFGPLDPSFQARVAAAEPSELEHAISRVLVAADLASVFRRH